MPFPSSPERDRPWVMRTYAGHASPAESNARYRRNLAKGQTGLSVAFDLPTQTGYDPDSPMARGEVGKVGVPISHLGDMRTLLASEDARARFAVELYIYRIGRELGSLAAAAEGIDALIFTAGIGEHAPAIRERVCRDAAWLGVELDPEANQAGESRISASNSKVSAWVIATNEELMIARHTLMAAADERR